MIFWRDEALILSYSRHGEAHALVEVFSREHGRHKGIVRGGGSRKQSPALQPGLIVGVEFSARLEEHLGSFKIEPLRSHVAKLMENATRLAGFQALVSMTQFSMEERDPHPRLYQESLAWLSAEDFAQSYVNWEIVLLSEAGFELDLTQCAVTNQSDNLKYISPKTGRAIGADAAGAWADRLLPYSPAFGGKGTHEEIIQALEVSEYFLTHWLAKMINKAKLPEARARFIAKLIQVG